MKIWIDLDNTPHVPFFKPVIRELEQRGYTMVLTARDAFQVCELATRFNLAYTKVGRHYGKNRILKVLGLVGGACNYCLLFCAKSPPWGCLMAPAPRFFCAICCGFQR